MRIIEIQNCIYAVIGAGMGAIGAGNWTGLRLVVSVRERGGGRGVRADSGALEPAAEHMKGKENVGPERGGERRGTGGGGRWERVGRTQHGLCSCRPRLNRAVSARATGSNLMTKTRYPQFEIMARWTLLVLWRPALESSWKACQNL